MKKLDVPQSGSQAGTTASRNRFGQYNRTRAMPTQPRTDAQLAVRARLNSVSKGWGSLAEEDRLSWSNYAAAHPRYDSLGQQITLTGHQMFIAVNTLNLAVGASVQTAVPTGEATESYTVAVTDPQVDALTIESLVAIPTTVRFQIMMSPPMSAGRSFNGDFRQVNAGVGTNASGQELVGYAEYWGKFGVPPAGSKIFYKIFYVAGGNLSAPMVGSFLTTPAP